MGNRILFTLPAIYKYQMQHAEVNLENILNSFLCLIKQLDVADVPIKTLN